MGGSRWTAICSVSSMQTLGVRRAMATGGKTWKTLRDTLRNEAWIKGSETSVRAARDAGGTTGMSATRDVDEVESATAGWGYGCMYL